MSQNRKPVSTTSLSVELDKIPEAAIKEFKRKDGTTGRAVNITALNYDSEDQFGKSASVVLSSTKEERDAGKELLFLGGGWHNKTKAVDTSSSNTTKEDIPWM
jgi:hypothetical protein